MRTTTFILALMAMFTLSASEVNLIKNGDFAEGGKHWMLLKGAKVSSDVKADGSDSAGFLERVNLPSRQPKFMPRLKYNVLLFFNRNP